MELHGRRPTMPREYELQNITKGSPKVFEEASKAFRAGADETFSGKAIPRSVNRQPVWMSPATVLLANAKDQQHELLQEVHLGGVPC